MRGNGKTSFDLPQELMWTIVDEGRKLRFNVPPIPMAGLDQPLEVYVDFNAPTVDALIAYVRRLRRRMKR